MDYLGYFCSSGLMKKASDVGIRFEISFSFSETMKTFLVRRAVQESVVIGFRG
eukprot:m.496615 g.496615  ORF g.496615 m.496615 type:complete len:53 (-) comp147686_c0_seq1:89-247(-)